MSKCGTLYIFGGLPGCGKSTVARHFAAVSGAVYLRVDSIEEVLLQYGKLQGPEGYEIAYSLAGDNLDNGLSVIADSVNPLEMTRNAWRGVATSRGLAYREIEIFCSDAAEHRKRLESRNMLVHTKRLVTWQDVSNREYEPWVGAERFDTSRGTIDEINERLVLTIGALA